MNGPGLGFDWLNSASKRHSESSSPAPPVSFGFKSEDSGLNEVKTTNPHQNHAIPRIEVNHPGIYSSGQSATYPDVNEESDSSIPLSLTARDLTLEESKTYMRWYSDILRRTNARTISLYDVFQFLNNFKIPSHIRDTLSRMFYKFLHSINIGEFFALLRLISHALNGRQISRSLLREKAPIPAPPSILSKKRQNDEDNDYEDTSDNIANIPSQEPNDADGTTKPLDLDGFTRFLLTGERPDEIAHKKKRSKKSKSVKFSDQIVTDIHDSANVSSPVPSPSPPVMQPLDLSLPMNQLLDRMQKSGNSSSPIPNDDDERQILKDMEPQMNNFQNLKTVDTASIDGVPTNVHNSRDKTLKPDMRGPSQFEDYFSSITNQNGANQQQEEPPMNLLKPNMTGPAQMTMLYDHGVLNKDQNEANPAPLRPNRTGPNDMARYLPSESQNSVESPRISLQSFTDQMTGNTLSNTQHNRELALNDGNLSPGSFNKGAPPPVPSRRMRSVSSPTPHKSPMDYSSLQGLADSLSPSTSHPDHEVRNSSNLVPPPPPSRRRTGTVVSPSQVPPPLPPKVAVEKSNEHYDSGINRPQQLERIDSTGNILDDLKALSAEVDRIRDMTGGF
ncbi:Piso0_005280 [Millerozyma farinosa CBS 7064]|uniref:Piso0_005280 protein n=1 Tax=Pichia sorbitophila (strain ATCC MYA-4447 / BCRC 22081 / CBS 7064 / NBRC 10061 / NRRL Y-12695) TaxID=559304 RepID=G8Y4P3_PICSO|nr:Piso0_005280 [Millerozyma farinosa CBS 7064]